VLAPALILENLHDDVWASALAYSPAVWARFYARSFGKAQRLEARRRMLEHGFGAAATETTEGPLTQR
jgi:hypothetical protein